MKRNDYNISYSTIIDDSASLQQFYSLTNQLSRNKKVRFIGKMDDADNIEWNFKYRGYPLTLQYNIYNGVILSQSKGKDLKVVNEVAIILKSKSHQ
ncbi:MAG TPA: hypothetical protein VN958_05670 [Chitinophagaceae bacterium]|nr:hypothetical protein [Chitinophagaceae bacterium]